MFPANLVQATFQQVTQHSRQSTQLWRQTGFLFVRVRVTSAAVLVVVHRTPVTDSIEPALNTA